jgi:hypothetical protein
MMKQFWLNLIDIPNIESLKSQHQAFNSQYAAAGSGNFFAGFPVH